MQQISGVRKQWSRILHLGDENDNKDQFLLDAIVEGRRNCQNELI